MPHVVSILLAVSLPAVLLAIVWRALASRSTLSRWVVSGGVLAGVVLAVGCWFAQAAFWSVSGLSLVANTPTGLGALLAMLLLAAPMEEGAKLASLWVLHQLGSLRKRADGMLAAVAVASGFAATESILFLSLGGDEQGARVVRALLAVPAHLFFAGLWGGVLANRAKLHLLSITWFAAMLTHGLYDHIVLGRGEGTLAVALPLLMLMTLLSWLGLRDAQRGEAWLPRPASGLTSPSLRDLRAALRRQERPLVIRWIVAGAFVTTGVVLVSLALAVLLGHELGVSFAAANEADMRSNGPLVLLGWSVLMAFPIAGYLVARASGATSVLEPAMGAALAIAAVVALLSLAAPIAVVFALAVAPVAFALACLGAWFGISK